MVADLAVPPLFYAAVRFALVAAITCRWLIPAPRPRWRLIIVALLFPIRWLASWLLGA